MASHPNPIEVSGKHNAIYEAYYRQVDSKNVGSIEAIVAAKFLKKSGLSDVVLSRIWDLSDPNGNGYLDKQGFFVALKLIALAQSGNDIHIRNILTDTQNPPKVGEIPKISQQINSGNWKISPNDIKAFDDLFNSHKPVNGLLSGNAVRNILITSRLPMDVLSKIWDYADQDRDGNLDKIEFAIAMHLVNQVCEKKRTLTMTLPTELEHKNVLRVYNESGIGNNSNGIGGGGGGGGGGLIDTSLISPDNNNFVANFPSDIPPPPVVPPLPISMPSLARIPPIVPPPPLMPSLIGNDLLMSPPHQHQQQQQHQLPPPLSLSQSIQPDLDWVVSSTDAIRFNNIFRESDADLDGLVSGLEIKDVFLQSGVPQLCLAQIWNLCDTNQCGKLTSQQFALAMWLVERKQRGIDPPQMLAPNMIPPSLRKDMGMMGGGGGGGGNVGGDISLMQSEVQPTYANPELEMIAKEIDELARERRLLETDVAQKEADIRIKTGEIRSLQSELDTLAATLKQLENQKGEAQKRLDDLKNQKINIDESLNSISNEIVVTRDKVNKIREQCQKQEETIKEQESELDSKRGELQKLKDEEQSLVRECDSNRTELDKLTVKLQDTQLQICQVKALVSQLIESQRQMNDALALCKEAIENNDPTLVYDYSLKLDPDFREAKGIILELEAPKKDPFNDKPTTNGLHGPSSMVGTGSTGFDTDPFNDNRPNKVSSGFDDSFNSNSHSGFDEPFTATFSNNKIQQNDPFAAATAAAASSPIKHSIESTQKDEFGSDPFAILHAPTSSSQILSPSLGLTSQKLGSGGAGAPPRPESPSPALPPKKSKQPPPRPAPPRPLQGPTPMKFDSSSMSDFGGSSINQNSSGFADFADFDTKTSTSDFTEDPFKDYRYEDPFSIQDPFESVLKSTTDDDDDTGDDDDDTDVTKDDPFGNNNNRIKSTMPYNNKPVDVFSDDVKINSNTTIFDNFSNLNTKMDIKLETKFNGNEMDRNKNKKNIVGKQNDTAINDEGDNDDDDDDDDDEDEYESSPQSATDFDDDQFDKFNKEMKLNSNNNQNNNNNNNKFNAFNDDDDDNEDSNFNGVIKNNQFMKTSMSSTTDDAFFDAFNDHFNKNLNFNETKNTNQIINDIKNNNNNTNKKSFDPFGGIDDKISTKQTITTNAAAATTTTAITDNFADFNDNFEDEFSKIDFIDNNNLVINNNNNVINNNLILKNNNQNQQIINDVDQNFATFDAFNDSDFIGSSFGDVKTATTTATIINRIPSPAAKKIPINKSSPVDELINQMKINKDIKDLTLNRSSIPRYRSTDHKKNLIDGKDMIAAGAINPPPIIDKKFTKDYSKTDTFEDDLQTILQRSLNEK